MADMGKLEFCENFVFLQRQPICFDGRPYLPEIYAATHSNLVLRCSRQTEKSTFLVNTILYEACPESGHSDVISYARGWNRLECSVIHGLLPSLEESPIIRRALLGAWRTTPAGNEHAVRQRIISLRASSFPFSGFMPWPEC